MNYRITEEQARVLAEYLRDLELAGKTTSKMKISARPYFDYLNLRGIDFLRVSVRDAQDFQVHLMTRIDEDGSIHYSKITVITHLSTLASFYTFLRRKKLIYTNPFTEIDRVRGARPLPRNIFTEEKMSLFLRSLRDFNRGANLADRKRLYKAHVVGELMYSTGARISEVAALMPGDLDFFRGVVRIREQKTGKIREGILNSYAEKILRLYVERMRQPVLASTPGTDKTLLFGSSQALVKQFNELLNRESKLLGFGGFSSHNFRHAVGYHLLRAGCDIRFIQDILGHRDLRSTQVYTRVDKEDLRGILDRFHPRKPPVPPGGHITMVITSQVIPAEPSQTPPVGDGGFRTLRGTAGGKE